MPRCQTTKIGKRAVLLYVNSGNAFSDSTHGFVIYCAHFLRNVFSRDALFSVLSEQNHAVAYRDILDISQVNHTLIHTNSSQYVSFFSGGQYLDLSAEGTGVPIGIYYTDPDLVKIVREIADLPGIEVEGVFTHFSKADEWDQSYLNTQFLRFMDCVNRIEKAGVHIKIRHCCNSAAIMNHPEMHLDMVRAGIVLYGLYPSEEVDKSRLPLIPAMSLKARVSEIKTVPKGSLISYGGRFEAPEDMPIGTISAGYADGYSRALSGKVQVLAAGEKKDVLGRICMDQCMFDLRNVQNISVGDSVTLFGKDGEQSISASEVAEKMGTINYEIVCTIGKRVPRIYI